jgi:RNA polymerase sigma-70 factor (ECF subfamily)
MSIQNRRTRLRSIPPGATADRSDAELLTGLQANQPWARREIWDRYAGRVRRYLARALGRPSEDVEDLTQDVFLRLFASRGAIRKPDALGDFAMAIAVRVLRGNLRARWVRRIVRLSQDGDLPEMAADRSPEEETRDILRRCRRILDALGPRERAAFTLRYMEEMTMEEVAATMKVSVSTGKRLVARATEIVATRVGRDDDLRRYFLEKTGGRR